MVCDLHLNKEQRCLKIKNIANFLLKIKIFIKNKFLLKIKNRVSQPPYLPPQKKKSKFTKN